MRLHLKLTPLLLLCTVTASLTNLSFAQSFNPGEDEIFKEFEVTEIRVTLSEVDKSFLLAQENAYSEEYVPADVSFSNSELTSASASNVGIRLRGNTARGHPKRSFKIDFKEFGGEQFFNYKKINLKPNANDPSLVRELLTMHIYRLMDVPAPRTAPAVLYFNDEYMGVYLMIEQIDDEFVDRRFGKEVGYLYKCAFGATLEDDGQVFDTSLYESKMNEDTDTRAELAEFVIALNGTSDSDFGREFENIFAVDRYLRQLAVEAITGHWDGYSYLNNNYYLYYDEDDGQFEFIAYDTDNTWGIDWVNRDWATRDLTHFHRNGHARPLTSRVLAVASWERRYYVYLNQLFEQYFTEEYLYPLFDQLEDNLADHVLADERFDDSFGFSYEDFKNSFDYAANGHVEYGLRGFVETRRSTGMSAIPEIVLGSSNIKQLAVFPNPSPNGVFHLGQIKGNELTAFDMLGRQVKTEYSRTLGTVKIAGEPGVYFLRIGEHLEKVVKL